MKSIWLAWVIVIIIAMGLTVVCHITAHEKLVSVREAFDSGAHDNYQMPKFYKSLDERVTFIDSLPQIHQIPGIPWPNLLEGLKRQTQSLRRINPDDPNLNAESLMGLAFVGPGDTPCSDWPCEEWFDRMSNISLAEATSDEQRRRLEFTTVLFQIMTTSDKELSLLQRAAKLDPDNSIWLYGQAYEHFQSVGRIEWDDDHKDYFKLNEGVTLDDALKAILPSMQAAKNLPYQSWNQYLHSLSSLAYAESKTINMLLGYQNSILHSPSPLKLKRLVNNICMLGDMLTKEGRDREALELFSHASIIAYKLLGLDSTSVCEGPWEVNIYEVMTGIYCLDFVEKKLQNYWAERDDDKVAILQEHQIQRDRVKSQIHSYIPCPGPDPLHSDIESHTRWLNRAAFTWVCSLSGLLMLIGSLGFAFLHFLLRRWRFLREPEADSSTNPPVWKTRTLTIFLMAILIIGIAATTTLAFTELVDVDTLAVWAGGMVFFWFVAIGALVRRSITGKWGLMPWIVMALVIISGCLAYLISFTQSEMYPSGFFIFAGFALLGIFIIHTAWSWIARRDNSSRRLRALRSRALALSMAIISACLLSVALGGLLWTANAQDDYWHDVLAGDDWKNNRLTAPLNEQLPPLEKDFFVDK